MAIGTPKKGLDAYNDWPGTIGKYGLGNTNDRGLRRLEFAKYQGLAVSNTFSPQKISRKATWHSPDGKTYNLIDYIMIEKRHLSSLNLVKTRTFAVTDVGSDHDLVMTTLKTRLKKLKRKSNEVVRYDAKKLKDDNILSAFQADIGGRLAPLLSSGIKIR